MTWKLRSGIRLPLPNASQNLKILLSCVLSVVTRLINGHWETQFQPQSVCKVGSVYCVWTTYTVFWCKRAKNRRPCISWWWGARRKLCIQWCCFQTAQIICHGCRNGIFLLRRYARACGNIGHSQRLLPVIRIPDRGTMKLGTTQIDWFELKLANDFKYDHMNSQQIIQKLLWYIKWARLKCQREIRFEI